MSTIGPAPKPQAPVAQPASVAPPPAKTAEETAPAKTETPAVQVSLSAQASANPALKVNSDGTVGPHHKPRHPHAQGTSQSPAAGAQPQEAQKLPGTIKV